MLRNRKYSRSLLVIEALVLAVPSFFGFLLFMPLLLGIFSGANDFVTTITILLPFISLLSFWHLMADLLTEEFVKGKKMNPFIRLFCGMGILCSILSLFFIDSPLINLPMYGFGIVYVPTFIHMFCEAKRQKLVYLANKSKSTLKE